MTYSTYRSNRGDSAVADTTGEDGGELAEVVLSKQEATLYSLLLRKYDGDPNERVSGRLLEFGPEHYADICNMFADTGADEMRRLQDNQDFDADMIDAIDRMVSKMAEALKDIDRNDEAAAIMQERGLDENPYTDQ